jgi:hypothetical protein
MLRPMSQNTEAVRQAWDAINVGDDEDPVCPSGVCATPSWESMNEGWIVLPEKPARSGVLRGVSSPNVDCEKGDRNTLSARL